MSDVLEVEITEIERGADITYKIRVISQRFFGSSFGTGRYVSSYGDRFIASNGFRLRSLDIPEVRQKNVANRDCMRAYLNNVLCQPIIFSSSRHVMTGLT